MDNMQGTCFLHREMFQGQEMGTTRTIETAETTALTTITATVTITIGIAGPKTEETQTTDTMEEIRATEATDNSHFASEARTAMDLTQMANAPTPQKMLDLHKFQTHSGAYSEHLDGSTNPTSTFNRQKTRKEDDSEPNTDKQSTKINMQNITANQKIHISAETLNCHGFAQSSEYVMNRLDSCDILCLTET